MEANVAMPAEEAAVPSERHPKGWMRWPRRPLPARVVPEGSHPLDAEAGHDRDIRLDRFFSGAAPDGAVAWVPGMEILGYSVSRYGAPSRDRPGGDVAVHPHIALPILRDDFVHPIGRDSVLGADATAVSAPEEFGGAEAPRATCPGWIENGGRDVEGIAWTKRTCLPRRGWDRDA